jgi:hypothetical protein
VFCLAARWGFVLARALGGAEGGGLGGGRGLVVLVGLLDDEGDGAVLSGDNTDGLFRSIPES